MKVQQIRAQPVRRKSTRVFTLALRTLARQFVCVSKKAHIRTFAMGRRFHKPVLTHISKYTHPVQPNEGAD